ncbi:MAG: ATP-grasp domain-containing protein, partial [Coriobacteriia bacterium]|nr:ATP-grasp domain-containing protein [Coriobacteriia bacterium]
EAIDAFDAIPGDVIIKPVDSQGSRGVQVCRTKEELVEKYPEAARWSSAESKGSVLIEKYIGGGREFVVEGLAFDDDFWNLCIGDTFYFDIDDSLSAKERTFPTIANDELRDRVLKLNEQIIRGFGLKQGITHSEFIMDGDDIYLLETAARGGGAFISSDLIPLSCGLDTAKYLVGIATGTVKSVGDIVEMMGLASADELDTIALNPLQHCCYVAFYIPAGTVLSVQGADEVRSLPYVHRTQIEHLEDLVGATLTSENTDKTSRYLVTISAPDRGTLEERMQFVRNTIKMDIQTPEGDIVGLIWE